MTNQDFRKQLEKLEPREEYMTTRIRNICREGFEASLPNIVAIAKGESPEATPSMSIRANETLGKYGLGKPTLLVEGAPLLHIVAEVTRQFLPNQKTFEDWYLQLRAQIEHRA